MEFSSFVAAIFIFLICLIVALKPGKIITIVGAVLILPLLLFLIYQWLRLQEPSLRKIN